MGLKESTSPRLLRHKVLVLELIQRPGAAFGKGGERQASFEQRRQLGPQAGTAPQSPPDLDAGVTETRPLASVASARLIAPLQQVQIVVISHDDRYYHLGDRIVKLEYGELAEETRLSSR